MKHLIIALSIGLLATIAYAESDSRVSKSMESLKGMTAKFGAPKLNGREAVGGKDAPALYFGEQRRRTVL
jgi:hypothetical protein